MLPLDYLTRDLWASPTFYKGVAQMLGGVAFVLFTAWGSGRREGDTFSLWRSLPVFELGMFVMLALFAPSSRTPVTQSMGWTIGWLTGVCAGPVLLGIIFVRSQRRKRGFPIDPHVTK